MEKFGCGNDKGQKNDNQAWICHRHRQRPVRQPSQVRWRSRYPYRYVCTGTVSYEHEHASDRSLARHMSVVVRIEPPRNCPHSSPRGSLWDYRYPLPTQQVLLHTTYYILHTHHHPSIFRWIASWITHAFFVFDNGVFIHTLNDGRIRSVRRCGCCPSLCSACLGQSTDPETYPLSEHKTVIQCCR